MFLLVSQKTCRLTFTEPIANAPQSPATTSGATAGGVSGNSAPDIARRR